MLAAIQLLVIGSYLRPSLGELEYPLGSGLGLGWARVWGWSWSWERSYSAPDDHLTASPDCSVIVSGNGRVDGVGGCPAICSGIISTPVPIAGGAVGVESGSPLNELCKGSPPRSNSGAITTSAPDDHFAAGPDCCVT